MAKTLYLIRHGETNTNVERRFSSPDDSLTDKGRQQAGLIAKRLCSLPIERIYTSSYDRAHETATIINQTLNVKLDTDDRLIEVRFPSEVVGQLRTPETQAIMSEIRDNVHPLDWHFSDAESWSEVHNRVNNFLEEVINTPEEHILVVSHGSLLQAIARCMMLGDLLTPQITQRVELFFHNANTGLSICDRIGERWRIRTWNEHLHLEN